MSFQTWLIHFILITNLLAYVTGQNACSNNGNITSTYKVNLDTLLSSLPGKMDINGFYNAFEGQNSDRVNAVALCRGDTQLDQCRSCVQNATVAIVAACPGQWAAIIWSDLCILRYTNESIVGILQLEPATILYSTQKALSPIRFWDDLRTLLNKLRNTTAYDSSVRKVAAGNTTTADSQRIYAMVMCIPDLSPDDCSNCIIRSTQEMERCCGQYAGGRYFRPSCDLRYEVYPFFNETRLQELRVPAVSPTGPPVAAAPQGKQDKNTTRTVIIIVVSIVASLSLLVFVGIIWSKKNPKKPNEEILESDDEISAAELHYDFEKIKDATNDFSDANKLGQGGFGAVYRGKFPNGQEIAVKRLSINSGQGDVEFKNEVLLLARLQHRNLVRLMGFSIEGNEKLLVYEFVENASLDKFLFDPIKRWQLDWDRRFKIIVGIARGLLYLHEDSRFTIIHRDLKPGNILLDGEMKPKIADFGMARLFVVDETQGSTNRIVGTYGYMAPEYAARGKISVKLDVFSFGVLILEIISGQKNNSFTNEEITAGDLLSCAWNYWSQRSSTRIIDPILRTSSSTLRNIVRCIHIGLLCVQENVVDRPTMASVVLMLSSFSLTLAIPSEPAFFVSSGYDPKIAFHHENNTKDFESNESSSKKSVNSSSYSKNDVSITDLYPR